MVSHSQKYGYEDERFQNAVSQNFHCSICLNVLKEPKMCQNNEHVFCFTCITQHLPNSSTCPECMEELTVETLRRAPRMLVNYLSELTINCDYFSRGCREFVRLEDLEAHVMSCGFAPVRCSNNECGMEIDKKDRIYHETEFCDFRRVKCHDCGEMKKEIEGIKEQLPEIKTNSIRSSQSVETFSWNKRAWTPVPVPAMTEPRSQASSFVYENQVFVAGGCTEGYDTGRMEVLKIDEQPLKWTKSPAKLPHECQDHKTVVYQNRLIHIGGYNNTEKKHSDTISEVLLTPPYSTKTLCRMPEPRSNHGVEIFNDKIMILGGSTSFSSEDSVNSVLEYDVNKNACKQMPPLPRAVFEMATVRWGDKVIVMGGEDKKGNALCDVLMYDCKTGESNVLPSMKRKRSGCTAIITRNVIVVMGGWNDEDGCLSSVECFTLGGNSWEELPPMIEPRNYAIAVVMPSTLQ